MDMPHGEDEIATVIDEDGNFCGQGIRKEAKEEWGRIVT